MSTKAGRETAGLETARGPRWVELSEEDAVETMVAAAVPRGRSNTRSSKTPPKLLGFDPSAFATEQGSRRLQDSMLNDVWELHKFATVCRLAVLRLATDVHANHALRRALQLLLDRPLPCPFSEPLLQEVEAAVGVLATHKYGGRVVIAAAAYDGASPSGTRLVDALLQDAAALALNKYGAHSLQAAMWHRGSGSRRGLEATALALQSVLPKCEAPFALSCLETGLELRLPGLAMAVARSPLLTRAGKDHAKRNVLRWVMQDEKARATLLQGIDPSVGYGPWLVIGDMPGCRPGSYLERKSMSKRSSKKRSLMELLFGASAGAAAE